MKNYDIAVVGEIYVDHVLTGFVKWPKPGEEVFTNEYVRRSEEARPLLPARWPVWGGA